MSPREKLPPEELRDIVLGVAIERFRFNRADTLHAFADDARDAILERFSLTPRDAEPVKYPAEVADAAARATTAVLEAWLAGCRSVSQSHQEGPTR